jgi:hypothetical protein
MRFTLKAVSVLVAAAFFGVLGLAIFSDLPAPVREVSLPIEVQ